MAVVAVATYRYRHEAEFAQKILADAGINSVVAADDAGGWHPELLLTRPVRLLVDSAFLEAAREALAEEDPNDWEPE